MKALRNSIIIAVVIALLILAKFLFFPSKKDKTPATKPGTSKVPTVPVTVVVANVSNEGNTLFATGTIVANEEAELRSEATGKIEYLNIPEGKSIPKGTLLLRVTNDDLRAQLDKIKAQLKLARESEQRQLRLLQIEGTSIQEYEQSVANLSALKADSAYFQAQLRKTEIRAPFSGIVGIRQVSPGSYITPTTIITTISQIDPVKIDFFLPEKYSALLSLGNKISFTIEGSTKTFKASIVLKDPKVDVTNRSVRFRALCSNPKGQLLPGSFARIELSLQGAKNIFIPTEAAIPTLKGKKVFVAKNGAAEEREIETGLRTAESVQVLAGLQEGDSVIVTGNYQLRAGAKVRTSLHKQTN